MNVLKRFVAIGPRPTYVQGQRVGGSREYFYYISHEGRLFLDNARMKNFTSAYKDEAFLSFFFKNLRVNDSGRYEEWFPWESRCGRERNFVACDDRPIVFTSIHETHLTIAFSKLTFPFQPSELCMFPNGRLYHPSALGHYGLVASKVADSVNHLFEFNQNHQPVRFHWGGTNFPLSNHLLKYAQA